jgi:beta-galactosidase
LTPYLKIGEKNVIAVRVDNSEQPNSRWYSGSGIYRNVWLVTVNPLHIDHWGTYIITPQISAEKAEVIMNTTVKNNSADAKEFVLHTIILNKEGKEILTLTNTPVELSSGGIAECKNIFSIEHPKLWSIENPYLYKVISRIEQNNQIIDNYETPLGIRSFEFDAERGFILNGKQVKINGVCNHHDLGCLGAAVNYRAIERQLEILKAMGCNGIRCSHNPPAPELLDLCDRMGFIVMNEAFDMWRKKKSAHDYSQFFSEWYERDLTDLILRDRNHPSVFMWSIGNEVLEQWTHAGTEVLDLQEANVLLNNTKEIDPEEFESGNITFNMLLTQKLADIVRKLDPTRPVTAGCNEARTINHLFRSGALDIIGFNYQTQDYLTVPQIFPGKPFIASETVSGLMSRGYYMMPSDSINIWPERWDKPFYRSYKHCSSYDNCHVPWGTTHEETWKLIKENDFISGQFIWTGFDYLGEPTPFWWPARSSYFGIIDLCGFPKDIYYMYQSEWTDKDVLHIFPHWNWTQGEDTDIWVYYNNADEVELFLNGQSLGTKKKERDDLHVWWRIPFEPGTVKAVARKNGKELLNKEIKTTGEPVSIRLTADRKTIQADGKDLSFVTVEALDAEGKAVPVAQNKINFSVEGVGFIAGTDNGDPTDGVSLKKPSRNLFNGKALVVIQAGKKAGKITLKATSEDLRETSIVITAK